MEPSRSKSHLRKRSGRAPRRRLGAASVVFVFLGAVPVQATSDPTFIGMHPHAQEQATARGRIITAVEGFAGRVYLGYGDSDRNTGPIILSSYEPRSGTWHDPVTYRTEEVGRFRLLAGSLWAPAFDPQGRKDIGYAIGDASHHWAAHPVDAGPIPLRSLGPVHSYDVVAPRSTTERFLTGAYEESKGGGVLRFTPETGWTVSLSVPGPATRFYNIAELDGRLYTVLGGVAGRTRDYDVEENSFTYDGLTWSRGPRLSGFIKPINFAGRLVYRSEDGRLLSFDGHRVDELPVSGAVDHDADGCTLVVISTADGRLHSTTDLRSWRDEGAIPPLATAVGLLEGVAYVGTAHSALYGLPLQ